MTDKEATAMPFYDLKCTDCNNEANIKATMSEKAERRIPCPKCGSTNMETVYTTAPAYIKNSGSGPLPCPSSGSCGNGGCRFAH